MTPDTRSRSHIIRRDPRLPAPSTHGPREISLWTLTIAGLVAGVLCAPLVLGAAGCAAAPTAESRAAEDFRLDLVVFAQPGAGAEDALLEPMRLILEPGGVLRAAYGHGVDAQVHPPLARTLSREQNDEIAELTRVLFATLAQRRGSGPASAQATEPAQSTEAGTSEASASPAAVRTSRTDRLTRADAAALMTSNDLIPAASVAGSSAARPVLVLSAIIDGVPRYAALEHGRLDAARPLLARLADLTWRPG